MVIFYTAVVQAGILYGPESWVISLQIGKVLRRFHYQVIWQLTGRIK